MNFLKVSFILIGSLATPVVAPVSFSESACTLVDTPVTIVRAYLFPCLSFCQAMLTTAVFLLPNPLGFFSSGPFNKTCMCLKHIPDTVTLNFPLVPKLPSIVPISPEQVYSDIPHTHTHTHKPNLWTVEL